MKLPTSNGNDLYQIGNDYPQVVDELFVASSYHDGIYTELKKTITSAEVYSAVSSLDGFDDSFFPPKNPYGLNKRVLNVPQSDWEVPTSGVDFVGDDISAISAVSATFSPDYAVGVFSALAAPKTTATTTTNGGNG